MNALPSAVLVRFSRALVGRLAVFCLTVPAGGQISTAYTNNPNYPPPTTYPAQPSSGAKIQKLNDKVVQLSVNDQRQDIRLYQLERDVDRIQQTGSGPKPTIEAGGAPAPSLIPFTTYQVRKGDSLWRIAMHHRVSPGELMSFNRMASDTVHEGQLLMIPHKGGAALPPPSALPSAAPGFHIVQVNETYFSIAKRYGVTIDGLAKANPNVNPNKLQPRMQLSLPGRKAAALLPSPAPQPPAKPPATHLVQPGESLSVIAHRYRVPIEALQKANNLADPNTLHAGQQLAVPTDRLAAAENPKPATTAAAPAPKTKTAPHAATTRPAAASSPPPAGAGLAQAPAYPGPPPSPPVEPTQPTSLLSPAGLNRQVVSYRMEKGDTVETVAKDFGTSASEIRRLNRLSTTSSLNEGDEILVPGMGAVN